MLDATGLPRGSAVRCNIVAIYCKRANIRGGFNFAMFAVDDFFATLKPPRSFYNTSVLIESVTCV